jgi:uncharacterized protein YpuA (DUF1002 family)
LKKKTILCFLLALALLASLAVPAFAQGESRVVVGADLNEEQIQTVYSLFGIERGSVTELTVTNAEERAYLEGLVEESVIGKYAISCVYVQLLGEGSGLTVETHNITWCTAEMYQNALITAGVKDAKIVVASPFEVSGTAALTGVYKAYESITGNKLDEAAKTAGIRELTVTGEIAEEVGDNDAAGIVNGVKEILGETSKKSDEELRREIVSIADRFNVTLSDSQIRQLIDLCRTLEKLDPDEIKSRVEEAQETIQRIGEAKDKAVSFYEKFKNFLGDAADFLERVKNWFN